MITSYRNKTELNESYLNNILLDIKRRNKLHNERKAKFSIGGNRKVGLDR